MVGRREERERESKSNFHLHLNRVADSLRSPAAPATTTTGYILQSPVEANVMRSHKQKHTHNPFRFI